MYIALLAVLSIVAVNTLIITSKVYRSLRSERIANSSAEASMERMIREIRFANTVDLSSSVLDSNPGKIVLQSIDPATDTPITVQFLLENGQILIQTGTSPTEAITNKASPVSNLVFRRFTSPYSESVKIEMTQGGSNFYGTATLRRSY